jgi:hypothetical protein
MNSPLIINQRIRPFAPGAPTVSCAKCTENAKWLIGTSDDNHFSCSRCFLHCSSWGDENKDKIQEFVIEIEKSIGKNISDNGAVLASESDRVLSAIVAVSEMAKIRAQKRADCG